MLLTAEESHVATRLRATRERWEREVADARSRVDEAREDERLAGQAFAEIDPDDDESNDRADMAFLKAIDRRVAAQNALERISSEHELSRRLENSEQLARRFHR